MKTGRLGVGGMMDKPIKEAVEGSHYGGEDDTYETIKVIYAWKLNFSLGNVVKYISRCGKKDNPIQELEKAKRYLQFEIDELKEKEKCK